MATNITNEKIKDSFSQLLHIDGGPAASPKVVYSATGTATALKLGTANIEVDNLRIDGNAISSTDPNGGIALTPNGTGAVTVGRVAFTDVPQARTALGLGSMATQASNAVAITGGTVSGVVFSGSFTGLTLIESATLATSDAASGVNLNGNSLAADGTNGNIDINITPKGTGAVNITKVAITSGTVPYATITGRAYAAFSDITDQTGSITVATAVKFGTTDVAGSGVTMVTDGSNLTRLTFAVAGTYMVAASMQLQNSDTADHDVTVWLSQNGTNVPRSATKVTVPKAGDGGVGFFQVVFYVTVTAGQYVQVFWLPENTAVTLDHTAAGAIAPAVPSAIIVSERIA